jgi:hypothetical protein
LGMDSKLKFTCANIRFWIKIKEKRIRIRFAIVV